MNIFLYGLKSTIKNIFVWDRYINGSVTLVSSQIQRLIVVVSIFVVCFILYKLMMRLQTLVVSV